MGEESISWIIENFDRLSEDEQNRAIKTAVTHGIIPFAGGHVLGTQMLKKVRFEIPIKLRFAVRLVFPIGCGLMAAEMFSNSFNRELRDIYTQVNKRS
mmetsp:Transcript_14186/g.26696  ORF Transcript_14186/g.26696 Transcript_14186/m.26696 type:complete len:98 (-) Transcript_14186:1335-1628(-)